MGSCAQLVLDPSQVSVVIHSSMCHEQILVLSSVLPTLTCGDLACGGTAADPSQVSPGAGKHWRHGVLRRGSQATKHVRRFLTPCVETASFLKTVRHQKKQRPERTHNDRKTISKQYLPLPPPKRPQNNASKTIQTRPENCRPPKRPQKQSSLKRPRPNASKSKSNTSPSPCCRSTVCMRNTMPEAHDSEEQQGFSSHSRP